MTSSGAIKNSLLLIILLMSNHNAIASVSPDTQELQDLKSLKTIDDSLSIVTDPIAIRAQAIKEAAVTVGIQGGIKYRYNQINNMIESMAAELDDIYNFKPLLIEDKMLPPIIAEADGNFGIKEDGSASSSLVAYEIIKDATIVVQPPQWRDYLIHEFQANTDLNPALKPKDDTEEAIWKNGVDKGWSEGIEIADQMSLENVNRLTRDYKGAIRFHNLAQQGIVTMPTLSIGDLGVHVNGKKLDINQRIFRITKESVYSNDNSEWKIFSGKQAEESIIK